MPTAFSDGVSDTLTGMWATAGFLDPRRYISYVEDFHYYASGDWTITATGSGSHALTDFAGGALLSTNAAADNDAQFLQKKGEGFRFAAGKKTWFEAKFRASEATLIDLVFGLQITDTTPLAVSDGVYFLKPEGAATFNFISFMNGAGVTLSAVATLVAATDIRLGFYYDGASGIDVYVNDVKVASTTVTLGTTLCNDEDLTISFGVQNGSAVARTLTTDYIIAIQER